MKKGRHSALLCTVFFILAGFTSGGLAGTMVEKNLFAPDRKPPSPKRLKRPLKKPSPEFPSRPSSWTA